jgi:hypothetical protein
MNSSHTEEELLSAFCTCAFGEDEWIGVRPITSAHTADCFLELADRLAFAQEISIKRGETEESSDVDH